MLYANYCHHKRILHEYQAASYVNIAKKTNLR